MVTITVDDRQLVITRLINILTRAVPGSEHFGFTDSREALNFTAARQVDVAFLDVEMPDLNGIELARKLQELHPKINIIFITGYKEYMPDAFQLYASGYLLKPIREEDVIKALSHLRYPVGPEHTAKVYEAPSDIRVQCFGQFEIYYRNELVNFPRSKCKALVAYLIDRRGAVCTNDMIMGNLWPDRSPGKSLKSMMRTVIADTKHALDIYGISDILIKESGGLRIDQAKIDCDYYRFLRGDPSAVRQYLGEYMSQYSFAEETRAYLIGCHMQEDSER